MNHRTTRVALFIVNLYGAAAWAAEAPKSPPATAALKKAEKAQTDADAAWRKASAELRRALLVELEAARAAAIKAGSADEANRIAAAVAVAESELARLEGRAAPDEGSAELRDRVIPAAPARAAVTVKVPASVEWTDAGRLRAGTYVVESTGKWRVGADPWQWSGGEGTTQNNGAARNLGKLRCRIGGERVVLIGKSGRLVLDAETPVSFGIVDDGGMHDNEGQLTVTVKPVR